VRECLIVVFVDASWPCSLLCNFDPKRHSEYFQFFLDMTPCSLSSHLRRHLPNSHLSSPGTLTPASMSLKRPCAIELHAIPKQPLEDRIRTPTLQPKHRHPISNRTHLSTSISNLITILSHLRKAMMHSLVFIQLTDSSVGGQTLFSGCTLSRASSQCFQFAA